MGCVSLQRMGGAVNTGDIIKITSYIQKVGLNFKRVNYLAKILCVSHLTTTLTPAPNQVL